MILGRGSAQTDAGIIADYHSFLAADDTAHPLRDLPSRKNAPFLLCQRIGKPIREWSDEDMLSVYQDRSRVVAQAYSPFLLFLLYRGYHRSTIALLQALPVDLSQHWKLWLLPYRQKIEQAMSELDYCHRDIPTYLTLLIWVVLVTGTPLEELTRAGFELFWSQYQQQYRHTRSTKARPNARLFRLERFLIHWGIISPKRRVFRHEEYFARLRHAPIRSALLRYFEWYSVKYHPRSVQGARGNLLTFFLWFQEQYPTCDRLDDVTRTVALACAQYLKQQGEEGHYGHHTRHTLYARMRYFFDFAIDEHLETAPNRNPFAAKDMPHRADMIPRYLSDQQIQSILSYCEREGSLIERTAVTIFLHTGIRASELAALKMSDIVQVQGIWKLHVHEGKGLKDRIIPLTPRCAAVLQEWKEKGWNPASEFLFTYHGRSWVGGAAPRDLLRKLERKIGLKDVTPHRFRHTFAVALLNYGVRESALQKLMGHADLGMTLEYARILDQTVERSFTQAVEQMQEGPLSWVPSFFTQEGYTLFAEGDSVSWIQLPVGFCRRNPKLHCESDVKCFLCERFLGTTKDLPRLRQMHERFLSLGLKLKADVVAAQIQQIEQRAQGDTSAEASPPQTFIPLATVAVSARR